jgi:hypothetical protein
MNYDLVLLPVSHPHKLLSISIKVLSGIELANDILVSIILETHHLCHLQLIIGSLDLVEDGVPHSSHPILVHPFCLHHRFLLMEVNRAVPIRVEE